VEVRYRPFDPDRDDADLQDAIVDAVDELARIGPGDVLVFLPGEREIRETAEALRKHHFAAGARGPQPEILPLFARLSAQEQERVFKPHGARRIVLATNVAETSLTVPGIRYVVDSGLARVKRYSYRNKVELLQVEKVSQAAAKQRAGRCGRVQAGVCIRLYDEDDYSGRPEFTDPEILRSSLAAVILRMKSLGLAEIDRFPFLEAPAPKAIADGYALLAELGAVDEDRALTPVGRQLARLPVDPRIGRMVLAAHAEGSLAEVLVIAAALSVQDPRERPLEKQQAADEAQKKFADEKSDFLGFLKLWKFFDEGLHHESHRKLARACREHFLSFNRMREWRDIHSQLKELAGELGWKPSQEPATYAQVHRALLAGLLGNIGLKTEEGNYLGARGIRFWIHPGSGLARKAPRWIVAAELTETTRLFARCAASVDTEWIEQVAGHLLKRSYGDPHWERKPAQAMALERATLYGLPVVVNRRVPFGPIDAKLAREIFIRDALVAGDYETRAPFFAHNQRLVQEIERLEHKSRRPDVLVDDTLIQAFYDALIPADVHSGAGFEAWRRKAEATQPKALYLRREDLMRHEAAGITTEQFPHKLELAGRAFPLEYLHDPGGARDGVTLTVPLVALNQVPAGRLDWLVPGLLKDKVQLLAKSLPQKVRHRLGPLGEFAARFVADNAPSELPLTQAIARYARRELQLDLPLDGFRPETLAPHLAMNIRVVDEHGRQLAMGRNLAQLRAELGQKAGETFSTIAQPRAAQTGLTEWTFGPLEELMEIRQGGQTLIGYPALVDAGESVSLELLDSPERARETHRRGLIRLFMLQLKEQARSIERGLPQSLALQYAAFGEIAALRQQLLEAAFGRACLVEPWPTDAAAFAARRDEARARVTLIAQEVARLAGTILAEYLAVQKKLAGARAHAEAAKDIEAQLARLVPKDFIAATPFERLQHLPRYLKAVALRIDKLRADPARDARQLAELRPLESQWLREDAKVRRNGTTDPQLEQFRWLLEELRVQLFAQELKTPIPVSSKRLAKLWQTLSR
jgi:ATP-dependent helicase HrpA